MLISQAAGHLHVPVLSRYTCLLLLYFSLNEASFCFRLNCSFRWSLNNEQDQAPLSNILIISWVFFGQGLADTQLSVSQKIAAFGTYCMIEISSSVQKSCLNILKPSGSLVAPYHGYVLNEPKR